MIKTIKIITLIAFSFSSFITIAQLSSLGPSPGIDTLQLLLKTDNEDTNKVLHLVYIARGLNNKNTDTAIVLSQQAILLAEKLKWSKGIAYAYTVLGWCMYVKGDYPGALQNYSKTLKIGEQEGNKKTIAIALSNIGQVYFSQGDGHKALNYNSRALNIEEEIGDEWGIARNIGIMGSSFQLLKDYSNALDYYSRAYQLTEKIGNKNGSAVWLSNMGDVYKEQYNYQKALEYYLLTAPIFKELGNDWSYSETLNSIGVVYTALKKYKESYNVLNNAVKLTYKTGSLDSRMECFKALSNLFKESNIPLPDRKVKHMLSMEQMRLEALNYYKEYINVRDTLFNMERQKKLMRLEFESKMASEKVDQEKKNAVVQQQIQKQKIIRNSFIAGSIMLLMLIVVLINRNKLKRTIDMERMRSRLSRDLHDDIGSTLSSINILSRTAQSNLKQTDVEKTKASLEKINERSQRLLDSMSDIIWNINPGNDTIEEVMSRMREYATTILEAKNIDYIFNFPKEKMDCKLTMEVKNNMYLIFKEAVNNLSKYSGCNQVILSLIFDDKNIHLKIEDNGKGFNEDEIKHRGGLLNMQHRAEEIKGGIKIDSVIGTGTVIDITMPRYC